VPIALRTSVDQAVNVDQLGGGGLRPGPEAIPRKELHRQYGEAEIRGGLPTRDSLAAAAEAVHQDEDARSGLSTPWVALRSGSQISTAATPAPSTISRAPIAKAR
jgi:hypothetical protein